MTQVIRVLNHNTVMELGLRFGWIKPIPTGVKTPAGDKWRLYGDIQGHRWTRVRKGLIPTQDFLGLWKLCKGREERAAAFGGVLPEVEEKLVGLGTPFSFVVNGVIQHPEFWKGTENVSGIAVWDFNPRLGAWMLEIAPSWSSMENVKRVLRQDYGIHHWTADSPEDVEELEKEIRERLGIGSA